MLVSTTSNHKSLQKYSTLKVLENVYSTILFFKYFKSFYQTIKLLIFLKAISRLYFITGYSLAWWLFNAYLYKCLYTFYENAN